MVPAFCCLPKVSLFNLSHKFIKAGTQTVRQGEKKGANAPLVPLRWLPWFSFTGRSDISVRSIQSDGLRQEYFYAGGRETCESGSTLKLPTRYFLLARFTRKSQGHVQGFDLQVERFYVLRFSPPASVAEYRPGTKGQRFGHHVRSIPPPPHTGTRWTRTVPAPPVSFRGGSLHCIQSRIRPVWPRFSSTTPMLPPKHHAASQRVTCPPVSRTTRVDVTSNCQIY